METLIHLRTMAESEAISLGCRASLAVSRARSLVSRKRVGGLAFVRVGRLSVSYCLTSKGGR